MRVTLKKAVRLAKYMPLGKPGQVVDIDDSQVERFVALGVIDAPAGESEDPAGDGDESTDSIDESQHPDSGDSDSEDDSTAGEELEAEAKAEPVKKVSTAKPKPTDSIDDHRAYLKGRDIDTKGLTRPQMIKIIAGLED